jgi:hypothetical protein
MDGILAILFFAALVGMGIFIYRRYVYVTALDKKKVETVATDQDENGCK